MNKAALLIILLAAFAGCDMCGNEISKVELSPDGVSKAIVFSRDCGATTGFNTQVSIIGTEDKLSNDSGNILIIKNKENLALNWLSNNHLEIKGNLSNETFKKEQTFKGVHITYVQGKL